jgi:hypothetical protein
VKYDSEKFVKNGSEKCAGKTVIENESFTYQKGTLYVCSPGSGS